MQLINRGMISRTLGGSTLKNISTPCTVRFSAAAPLLFLEKAATIFSMRKKTHLPQSNDPQQTDPQDVPSAIGGEVDVDQIAEADGDDARMREILATLYVPSSFTDVDVYARLNRALDLFDSIAPKDGAEDMLATQMIGVHGAAMECMRLAAEKGQDRQVRNQSLAQAEKLIILYTKQMAALDKHRGKGQQRITVERVDVQNGANAIVGSVEVNRTCACADAHTIDHGPAAPLKEVGKSKSDKRQNLQSK